MAHKSLSVDLSPLEEQTHIPILHHDSAFESDNNGLASVYLYKRESESAAEILQPLISQDPRHFRYVAGERVSERGRAALHSRKGEGLGTPCLPCGQLYHLF